MQHHHFNFARKIVGRELNASEKGMDKSKLTQRFVGNKHKTCFLQDPEELIGDYILDQDLQRKSKS